MENADIIKQDKKRQNENMAGALQGSTNAAETAANIDRFNAAQGHGFAAEQANNLHDILTGKNALIVGGNNAKDGADRIVNDVFIQTKYCATASDTVAAGFRNGVYRYYNADGSVMQLEVPPEQYDKAVELMAKRIANGQVPGVSNPDEAANIVRKGTVTYKQAQNIAKMGTVESLTYDAVNGAVVAVGACGISAAVVFAKSVWNGDSTEVALENAACTGLEIGGAAFATSVITSQLSRTAVGKAAEQGAAKVVELMGKDNAAKLATVLQGGTNVAGAGVAKVLGKNAITMAVLTVVLSAGDISNAFRGRISGQQLFKNLTIKLGSLAGGLGGLALGTFLLGTGPAGWAAGFVLSIAGSELGGQAVNSVLGEFIEDDAVVLVKIIEETLCQLGVDYMLSEDELEIVLGDLSRDLAGETLLEMFASSDRKQFADDLVRGCIEKAVRIRCRLPMPRDEQLIWAMGQVVADANNGTGIFAAGKRQKVDAVALGKEITGKELSPQAAKTGLYYAKQMNMVQKSVEMRMAQMVHNERQAQTDLAAIRQERADIKEQINAILEG